MMINAAGVAVVWAVSWAVFIVLSWHLKTNGNVGIAKSATIAYIVSWVLFGLGILYLDRQRQRQESKE